MITSCRTPPSWENRLAGRHWTGSRKVVTNTEMVEVQGSRAAWVGNSKAATSTGMGTRSCSFPNRRSR